MLEQLAEGLMSAEEFLEWESAQPYKHELIDNRVYEMTGASRSHNRINLNLVFALENRISSQGCEVYAMDMRVQVEPGGTYTYPDVIVVCGEPRFRADTEPDTLLNPTLLFEILSPSTELKDRNRKLDLYLELASLEGYFLVSQDQPRIESYIRQVDGWFYQDCSGLDAILGIGAINCEIPLQALYNTFRLED